METYAIPAQSDLARLAHLAADGHEVVLTENDKPLAKLVPLDEEESYRTELFRLQSLLRGIDTEVYREEHDRL